MGDIWNITSNDRDDNHLWLLMKQGDKIALADLMDHYMDQLYNYGIRFTGDGALIEDCIQNLFISIWQRRDFLSTPQNLKSYLFSSIRRMICRKARYTKKVPIISLSDNEAPAFDFELSIEHTLIQQEESRIIAQKINELIAALPKRQKEIIYLKFFENLSREEIAEIMQITPQAVSNTLQKALKNMRSVNAAMALIVMIFFCFYCTHTVTA